MVVISTLVPFLTLPSSALAEVDRIVLFENDDEVKEIDVNDYNNLEDLLEAIAEELDDFSNSENSDDNSNAKDSNNDNGGGKSSSSNSDSNDNNFENSFQAANAAFESEMERFDSDAQPQAQQETDLICHENEVLNPDTGVCETPQPIATAISPLTGSAAASAVIPIIPTQTEDLEIIPPPVQEEEPIEENGSSSDKDECTGKEDCSVVGGKESDGQSEEEGEDKEND